AAFPFVPPVVHWGASGRRRCYRGHPAGGLPRLAPQAPASAQVIDDAGSTISPSEGRSTMAVFRNIFESIGALALLFIVFLVVTFPVTWLLMLFLGNVGANLSYWGTLPLGTVVSLIIGASSSGGYRYCARTRPGPRTCPSPCR